MISSIISNFITYISGRKPTPTIQITTFYDMAYIYHILYVNNSEFPYGILDSLNKLASPQDILIPVKYIKKVSFVH